ncbi:MAG: MarR family transcriptional regulator [Candidatus Cloacimonadales bacterium]|jgi:DNA-binding MarR family transcriptional regulator|nr:MarR family transcriptional regulator [Candidatus Cloacimonadota bacterium]MDD2651072.1 MarR family transcriptional regulator [Candidatus Cloacimonadota bacterium]MDX9977273.1 MarR family transcriptional regulator [Candidatus Cloacimonadales bacterium]
MKKDYGKDFYAVSNEILDLLYKTGISAEPDLNLGKAEVLYLRYLKEQNKPVKMKELSEALGVSHSRITHLSDSLIKKGYIKRVFSNEDRRVLYANLTEKANQLLDDDNNKRINIYTNLIKDLALEETETILNYLKLWKEHLTKITRG